ncbi:NADP-reducing hydrogenase subunit HndA [bacterium BMS3Abin10]|nr:NADP-reducing hydrogenase subunit HndA [bacterium BMS3Abin10]GBE39048.1 NADP-reducing hydrogenase subunit HndA [bacterium BMS3Bbin08]
MEITSNVEKTLNRILKDFSAEEGNIISLLQLIQDEFGYIPESTVGWFSGRLDIPESRFYGIATFYARFYQKERGKNIITACCGTACHVKGADRVINAARIELGLAEGENTTDDMDFTLEQVACVGACSIAPVVIINKKVYGRQTSGRLTREIKALKK